MAEALAEVKSVGVETSDEPRVALKMPEPKGYKILIALPQPDEKTEGGILKAQSTLEVEEVGSIVGLVLAMGPDAYSDKSRFPSGPYCKVDDFVVMRSYSGTRFKVQEDGVWQEFRLINDDSVEAVVEDPRGIRKV
jgi:co-chaperonin GroES (HSP10)|tara:strand:+ start:746 stop:1153 length:408 start_codon:yes stop_codon:yes gene_type:complete